MRLVTSLAALDPADFPRGSVVAVGKFDGAHLGHAAIIEALERAARELGAESTVFTFENNPLALLKPEACPKPIASPAQRVELLEATGIDCCVMVPFDEEFAAITARDFVEQVLMGRMRVRHVILGAEFRFGHRGLGDAALLRELGEEHGFAVEIVESVSLGGSAGDPGSGAERAGERVSSSRIREAVLSGDVALAGAMLGRPYAVRGEVVHGDARGRELGFPTANLGGEVEGLVPADGIYGGSVVIDGVERLAAISVGVNLTFDPEGDPRVEAFILDFSGDLYGKTMEVRFRERIRAMLPFDSVDALVARMHEDVAETREMFEASAKADGSGNPNANANANAD